MGSSGDRKFVISLLVLVFCGIAYLGDIRATYEGSQEGSQGAELGSADGQKVRLGTPSLVAHSTAAPVTTVTD